MGITIHAPPCHISPNFPPPPLLAGSMGLLPGNRYRYIDNLIILETSSPLVLDHESQLALPLPLWELYLKTHPDQRLTAYLRRGLQFGFRVGFNTAQPLESGAANHPSVHSSPDAVSLHIQNEVADHRLTWVLTADWDQVHTSLIGIIPKSSQPGKYHLIHDLSFPPGHSVNDSIPRDLCSLHYSTVDDAVLLAKEFGQGALLAKLDLQSTYRRVPVHALDQPLLGLSWDGELFQDQRLPFGLHSAPVIFTAMADGLAWAMTCLIHYLDDFPFVGPPGSPACANSLDQAVVVCSRLGASGGPF